MVRRSTSCLIALFVLIGTAPQLAMAQNSATPSSASDSVTQQSLKIVPLVTLKPGESTKFLLSSPCTVGATRGGGFELAEMQAGKAVKGQTEGYVGASYQRDGVEIRIPGWDDAQKFAAAPMFAAAKEQGVQVFEVTVTAASTAKPGLFNMHLVDATCSGHCETDFRVLIISPK